MKNIDDILAKVQKLLNVEGRTPEEAAAYVERAHAILAEYDLSIESVANLKADSRTAIRETEAGISRTTQGKPDGWKGDLLVAVAQAFECRIIWSHEGEYTKSGKHRYVKVGNLVGFGHDVESAGYAHSFLIGEVTRLGKEYAKTHWDAIRQMAADLGMTVHDAESRYVRTSGTHPLKAELYFVKGAAQTVAESLTREAQIRKDAAARENPNAITIQKGDAVRDYMYQKAYGMTYEEVMKRREAQNAAYAAERASRGQEGHPEAKKETDSARRRREEAEDRANRKANEAYWNRYYREQAKIDHDALRAGQTAGRSIKIRVGVGGGIGKDGQIG